MQIGAEVPLSVGHRVLLRRPPLALFQRQAVRPEVGPVSPLPLPGEQITALLTRGDAFVRTRDIASARLFYERAADAGNGRAALRMGESFDRAFLDSIGIYRMIGDRQLALSWYRRARDLGDTEAAQLLHKLEPR